MTPVNYYKISYSVDKKVTGTKDAQIINFIDPENNSVERSSAYSYFGFEHINPNLDFTKFKADGKAKMTDVISCHFFSSYLFISAKLKNLLNDYVVNNIIFLECMVSKNEEKHKYYIVSCIETIDIVNFSASTFIGDKSSPALRIGGEIVKTDSYYDYMQKTEKIWNDKGFGFILVPQKIVLNYTSDMIKFPFGELLISEQLKARIENESLTGVVIEKADIEFFC